MPSQDEEFMRLRNAVMIHGVHGIPGIRNMSKKPRHQLNQITYNTASQIMTVQLNVATFANSRRVGGAQPPPCPEGMRGTAKLVIGDGWVPKGTPAPPPQHVQTRFARPRYPHGISQAADGTEEAPAAAPAAPQPPPAKAKGGKAAASRKRPAAEPPAPAQPKRAAAPPPRAPAQPALMVGAAMEVQGCGEGCDLSCNTCEWEACTIVADHGVTCDVRITSDGDLCQGVQRRHLRRTRRTARAVGKRAAAPPPSPT